MMPLVLSGVVSLLALATTSFPFKMAVSVLVPPTSIPITYVDSAMIGLHNDYPCGNSQLELASSPGLRRGGGRKEGRPGNQATIGHFGHILTQLI